MIFTIPFHMVLTFPVVHGFFLSAGLPYRKV